MPITAKQFELGIDSVIEEWMRKIHQFLALHKEAFTGLELAKELDGFNEWFKQRREKAKAQGKEPEPSYFSIDNAFNAALDKLVEIRVVESRTIRDKEYYALGDAPLSL